MTNKAKFACIIIMSCLFGGEADAQSAIRFAPSQGNLSAPKTGPSTDPNKPLAELAYDLNSNGIFPLLAVLEFAYTPISVGRLPNINQFATLIDFGVDWNLGPLTGLDGTSIHFRDFYVPFVNDQRFGSEVAGAIVGGGVFIPWENHLQRLTLKQDFFDGKAFVEIGKSNAGDYIARPICNIETSCVSNLKLLQRSAGFLPPPYANYSLRTGADLSESLKAQVGFWRVDNQFPFSDGYEIDLPRRQGVLSVFDLVDKTDFSKQAYPHLFEIMYYNNTSEQIDPLTKKSHFDSSGIYGAAKQVIWRPDATLTTDPNPMALSAFAAGIVSFDKHTTQGIVNSFDFGLMMAAPFASRPFDTYSIQASIATLSASEQAFIQKSYLAQAGRPYDVGRTEKGLTINANFRLTPDLFFRPYVGYAWNTTLLGAQNYTLKPRDGFNAGFTILFLAGQSLGFGRSGYIK